MKLYQRIKPINKNVNIRVYNNVINVVIKMMVNNLSKSINGKDLLNDISFSINDDKKIGLVENNDAGKSTLLNIIWENKFK